MVNTGWNGTALYYGASRLLEVAVRITQKWGKLDTFRTVSGKYRVSESEIKKDF